MHTSRGHIAATLTHLHELYQRAATFILRDQYASIYPFESFGYPLAFIPRSGSRVLSTLRHHDDLKLGIIQPQDTLATVLMSQVEAAEQQVVTAQSVTQWLTEKAPTPRRS